MPRRELHTNLCPYHLRQSTDEMRCCIDAHLERFFVYDFADREPEGGLESLRELLSYQSNEDSHSDQTSSNASSSVSAIIQVAGWERRAQGKLICFSRMGCQARVDFLMSRIMHMGKNDAVLQGHIATPWPDDTLIRRHGEALCNNFWRAHAIHQITRQTRPDHTKHTLTGHWSIFRPIITANRQIVKLS